METGSLRNVLDDVRRGNLGVDEALAKLGNGVVADIGFAHVDLDRRRRCGYPEVIFCQGKTGPWIEGVIRRLLNAGQDCLATRVDDDHAAHLASAFPAAQQEPRGPHVLSPCQSPLPHRRGRVVVLTAGTSDLPVAKEAVVTIQALGSEALLIADVGGRRFASAVAASGRLSRRGRHRRRRRHGWRRCRASSAASSIVP